MSDKKPVGFSVLRALQTLIDSFPEYNEIHNSYSCQYCNCDLVDTVSDMVHKNSCVVYIALREVEYANSKLLEQSELDDLEWLKSLDYDEFISIVNPSIENK